MPKFTPATFGEEAFNCPYCGVYARHTWQWVSSMRTPENRPNVHEPDIRFYFSETGDTWGGHLINGLNISSCSHCHSMALWLRDRLLLPPNSNAEPPHDDMPVAVRAVYEEASEIVDASPRGAAALLRVALELLTHELECDPAKKINENIGQLVKQGLSPEIIKALDIVRVTGNKAAHTAGTLLLDDDRETATALFQIINYIVEQTIAYKRRLEEMHDRLPEGIKRQIEQRNMRALPKADD